ncbi:MAG: nucleotidyltransferase family protein [Steroidobacteraceae bacterium]
MAETGRCEAARAAARDRLRQALAELLPSGSEVWVFGSVFRPGKFRENSDVDIAVESLPPGMSEAWLQYELALRMDRGVDVLNLKETGLRARIEREGCGCAYSAPSGRRAKRTAETVGPPASMPAARSALIRYGSPSEPSGQPPAATQSESDQRQSRRGQRER